VWLDPVNDSAPEAVRDLHAEGVEVVMLTGDSRTTTCNLLGVAVAAGVLYPVFGLLLSPGIATTAMCLCSVSITESSLHLRNTRMW
jgi:cation transport ATPase